MSLTVIIPTYRRPKDLRRVIHAVRNQVRSPIELVVVVRGDDVESCEVLAEAAPTEVRTVIVEKPGVLAAMNAGLAAATGDIIALTDDDASPWPDWAQRIKSHFAADPHLGALGGKDWQYKGEPLRLDDGRETRAGEMQWWGRVIGQHHWAAEGPAREVAVVKGVNCAFRAEALRAVGGFDTRLAGTGAQVHWELSLCLALKRAGWKVVFDPAIGVDHFPAVRFDEDQRGAFVPLAHRNAVANETLILLEHFGYVRKTVFLAWAALVGTRASPGLVQLGRFLAKRQPNVWQRWKETLRGRRQGIRMLRAHRRGASHAGP
jgi:GT2 family glycosyltransferase